MGQKQTLEDLLLCKIAGVFVRDVYRQSVEIENYTFNDRIRKIALAIFCNIVEGNEASSQKEYKMFLYEAMESCGEMKEMLQMARNQEYMEEIPNRKLNRECHILSCRVMRVIERLEQMAGEPEEKKQNRV